MSTTCMYSDIVLPTATWYEKHDLNTSDMHPFIHPLSAAVDPAWESRTDWAIFKGIAKRFSRCRQGHLGVEQDVVLTPLMHDSPGELGQTHLVRDWKKGEVEPIPGKTMPAVTVVERDYPQHPCPLHRARPADGQARQQRQGHRPGRPSMRWSSCATLNGTVEVPGVEGKLREDRDRHRRLRGAAAPRPRDQRPCRGEGVGGAGQGHRARPHAPGAPRKEHEAIRFRDVQAQPRKIISSPIWSGIESEEVCYNAGYTNVHELIPWRTLTGRQQLYQDHPWMLAFGEALCLYRPPVDLRAHWPDASA